MVGSTGAVPSAVTGAAVPGSRYDPSAWSVAVATVGLTWYIFIALVCTVGYVQLRRHYSSVPATAVSESLPLEEVPHVTVLRPVKGVEPHLYDCLAATFRQTYPLERLTVYFCISSRDDPAYPILERLLVDFPRSDAKILVEEEDANLLEVAGEAAHLGPNPKIRNMSRGYREAKGDLLWVLDCNVWVGSGVAGRLVDKLCGLGGGRRYKFVHQLPLAVEVGQSTGDERVGLEKPRSAQAAILADGGGRLEELFLASSHAKMYTAINTVLIAPCIVGKSNMFRRSHLDSLTATHPHRRPGIDSFSDNICEDHLIGDLLWRGRVPGEAVGEKWGKHALVFGDLAIQPMGGMSVRDYLARRVRWLRVRKFTVMLATFVEPGTESFVCSLYLAYAVTTLSFFQQTLHIPSTWPSFCLVWLLSISLWSLVDWTLYVKLHSAATVEPSPHLPPFARPPPGRLGARRPFAHFLAAWLAREALALPIWAWAFWGGTRVVWRGRVFRVGVDMKVHEVGLAGKTTGGRGNGHFMGWGKSRVE
ncbi:MAG: hypothetical protein M1832_002776 [Thelocarpon impressellum]|nr:MAG: hypothetical protein M1832_002776 [Thelocarpon impressellum]